MRHPDHGPGRDASPHVARPTWRGGCSGRASPLAISARVTHSHPSFAASLVAVGDGQYDVEPLVRSHALGLRALSVLLVSRRASDVAIAAINQREDRCRDRRSQHLADDAAQRPRSIPRGRSWRRRCPPDESVAGRGRVCRSTGWSRSSDGADNPPMTTGMMMSPATSATRHGRGDLERKESTDEVEVLERMTACEASGTRGTSVPTAFAVS